MEILLPSVSEWQKSLAPLKLATGANPDFSSAVCLQQCGGAALLGILVAPNFGGSWAERAEPVRS